MHILRVWQGMCFNGSVTSSKIRGMHVEFHNSRSLSPPGRGKFPAKPWWSVATLDSGPLRTRTSPRLAKSLVPPVRPSSDQEDWRPGGRATAAAAARRGPPCVQHYSRCITHAYYIPVFRLCCVDPSLLLGSLPCMGYSTVEIVGL